MRGTSLRRRATFGIAVVAFLVVGAHSTAVYYLAETLEDNLMDRVVQDELDHLADQFRLDVTLPPPRSQLLKTYVVRDAAARAQLPDFLREVPDGIREINMQNRDVHIGARTEAQARFYVVYDVTLNENRLRQLVWLLVLGVVLTTVVAAVLGYVVAGLVIQPVASLAARVRGLGPDRPVRPLGSDFAEQEIAPLAQAMDGYLDKVAELVEREREFTANVSHELRTPLTSIQTGCELLLQRRDLAEEDVRRVESIRRAAERLTEIVRSLLLLARGGETSRSEEVSVRECVSEAAEPVLPALTRKGIAFDLDIDPAAMVRVDRTALLLVAGNLLRNASYYTERGHVKIAYRDGSLTIEDSGPGIDTVALTRVGERFYRGERARSEDGFGLGLAIVKRICERYDWRLEISSRASVGTRVTVRFPLPTSQNLHVSSTNS